MGRVDKTRISRNDTGRLEAFSDAVFGILITITVLGLRPPATSAVGDLKPLIPKLLIYALSFTFLGIYWNNHHHLLRATKRINGWVMWANLYLLFWLSLIPIITEWVGEHPRDPWPAAFYGIIAVMTALAYSPILTTMIIRANKDHPIASVLSRDIKGIVSILVYLAAIGLAFLDPLFSFALYVVVAILWFIPDKRLEDPFFEPKNK
jgi:uncharacterized membrane protein